MHVAVALVNAPIDVGTNKARAVAGNPVPYVPWPKKVWKFAVAVPPFPIPVMFVNVDGVTELALLPICMFVVLNVSFNTPCAVLPFRLNVPADGMVTTLAAAAAPSCPAALSTTTDPGVADTVARVVGTNRPPTAGIVPYVPVPMKTWLFAVGVGAVAPATATSPVKVDGAVIPALFPIRMFVVLVCRDGMEDMIDPIVAYPSCPVLGLYCR
jgi:hypothetical protein